MSAERRKRLLKVLELISTRAIHTQEELAEALRADGWQVTQSSVSRDIAALRLVKSGGAYHRPPSGAARSPDPDRRRVAEDVIGVESAGESLIVLHTPPGEASAVGLALDRLSVRAFPAAGREGVATLAGSRQPVTIQKPWRESNPHPPGS